MISNLYWLWLLGSLTGSGAIVCILLTSKKLHLIDDIVGEYHEIGGNYDSLNPQRLSLAGYEKFTIEELELFLNEQNFTFIHRETMD